MIGNRRASPLLRVDFDNTHPDRIAGLVYLDAAYSYAFDNGKDLRSVRYKNSGDLHYRNLGPRILPASLRSGNIMSVCSGSNSPNRNCVKNGNGMPAEGLSGNAILPAPSW
jgi:hypothetical protein